LAESDSFIQEVSEEVRRDRMYAVWRRYGPWLIAAIVLVVLLAAGRGWWEGQVDTRKAELGGALLAADTIEDPVEASAAFLAVAEEGDYAYPVVARLRAAAALMQSGQLDEAEAQYEMIKALPDADPRYIDLAELRIIMMRSETMDPGEMLDRLGPLTVDSSVWRLPALEYEAAAHLKSGDPDAALASLRSILDIPELGASTQGRIIELIAAIDETVDIAEPSEDAGTDDSADSADSDGADTDDAEPATAEPDTEETDTNEEGSDQ